MAPSRRLGCLVVLCALAAAHEPTEHERLDTDYDYVVKTRSKRVVSPGVRAGGTRASFNSLVPDGLLRAGTNWFVWAWGAVMAAIEAGPELLPTLSMEDFENRARELALAALNLSNNGVLLRRNEAVA